MVQPNPDAQRKLAALVENGRAISRAAAPAAPPTAPAK
jgi:hypothetical protein